VKLQITIELEQEAHQVTEAAQWSSLQVQSDATENGTLEHVTEVSHQAVLDALAALRDALRSSRTPDAERALYHCDRLEQAVKHWHAEAIRFAAYTINHIVSGQTAQFGAGGPAIHQRVQDLRAALAAEGHTF